LTAATLLLEQGVDVRVVQQILGHSQLSQAQRYTQVTAARRPQRRRRQQNVRSALQLELQLEMIMV
jgi:site-specific recombinase XerD